MTPSDEDLAVATRFALALDAEDYPTATALLEASASYAIRGQTFDGPDAIIESYRANGDSASSTFDSIAYSSAVREGEDGWLIIAFADHLTHAGRTHEHRCEQWVQVRAGLIHRIEHHDLPGERERLDAFKQAVGL